MFEQVIERANEFIRVADEFELTQKANIKARENLLNRYKENKYQLDVYTEELDIIVNAINILKMVSDDAVHKSYEFMTENINNALERIFVDNVRKIRIVESMRADIYPQLEIELQVEKGVTRSLSDDSGHGIAQIISLLCILSVMAITKGCRRLLVLDEVFSGLSANSRAIMDDILWAFTEIGFQFVICEHGYVPRGAQVVKLEMVNGVTRIKDLYIEQNGVYLNKEIRVIQYSNQEDLSEDEEVKVIGMEGNKVNIIDIG